MLWEIVFGEGNGSRKGEREVKGRRTRGDEERRLSEEGEDGEGRMIQGRRV